MIVSIAYISCLKAPAAFIFIFQAIYLKNNRQTFRIIWRTYASSIHQVDQITHTAVNRVVRIQDPPSFRRILSVILRISSSHNISSLSGRLHLDNGHHDICILSIAGFIHFRFYKSAILFRLIGQGLIGRLYIMVGCKNALCNHKNSQRQEEE